MSASEPQVPIYLLGTYQDYAPNPDDHSHRDPRHRTGACAAATLLSGCVSLLRESEWDVVEQEKKPCPSGVVWCGLVWSGVVWCGLAFRSMRHRPRDDACEPEIPASRTTGRRPGDAEGATA
ncbi:hypothetical protein PMIN05_010453 [Paraphaeosphaeria minitans]